MSEGTSSKTVKPWPAGHVFICGCLEKRAALPVVTSSPLDLVIVPAMVILAHRGSSGSSTVPAKPHVALYEASLTVMAAA